MTGVLAIFLLLGIIDFHLEFTAADEYHAATEIMAEIAEASALDRRALKEMVVDHVPMMGVKSSLLLVVGVAASAVFALSPCRESGQSESLSCPRI